MSDHMLSEAAPSFATIQRRQYRDGGGGGVSGSPSPTGGAQASSMRGSQHSLAVSGDALSHSGVLLAGHFSMEAMQLPYDLEVIAPKAGTLRRLFGRSASKERPQSAFFPDQQQRQLGSSPSGLEAHADEPRGYHHQSQLEEEAAAPEQAPRSPEKGSGFFGSLFRRKQRPDSPSSGGNGGNNGTNKRVSASMQQLSPGVGGSPASPETHAPGAHAAFTSRSLSRNTNNGGGGLSPHMLMQRLSVSPSRMSLMSVGDMNTGSPSASGSPHGSQAYVDARGPPQHRRQNSGGAASVSGMSVRSAQDSLRSFSRQQNGAGDLVVGWCKVALNSEAGIDSFVAIMDGHLEVFSSDSCGPETLRLRIALAEIHLLMENVRMLAENFGFAFRRTAEEKWTVFCRTQELFAATTIAITGAALQFGGADADAATASRSGTIRRQAGSTLNARFSTMHGSAGDLSGGNTSNTNSTSNTGGQQAPTMAGALAMERQSLKSTLNMLLPEPPANGVHSPTRIFSAGGGEQQHREEAYPHLQRIQENEPGGVYASPQDTEADWGFPDGRRTLTACSVNKMLELLSPAIPYNTPPAFLDCFMFTYRCLMKPEELVRRLELRFWCAERHLPIAHSLVQIRVLTFVTFWLQRCYNVDFRGRAGHCTALERFLEDVHCFADAETCVFGRRLQRVMGRFAAIPLTVAAELSPGQKRRSILDVDAKRLARRITMLDHTRFSHLRPVDFFIQLWAEPAPKEAAGAPSKPKNAVGEIIDWFNKISYWCATEVITTPELKLRIKVVEQFIRVARECHALGNYNSLFAVISGMSNASVTRLKETWAGVDAKYMNILRHLETEMSMSNNFRRYRSLMEDSVRASRSMTFIPIMGLFLKDLLFISDGNPKYVAGSGFINVERLGLMVTKVNQLLACQRSRYQLALDASELAACDAVLSDIRIAKDDALYKLSLLNEARAGQSGTVGGGSSNGGTLNGSGGADSRTDSLKTGRKERLIEKWEREAKEKRL